MTKLSGRVRSTLTSMRCETYDHLSAHPYLGRIVYSGIDSLLLKGRTPWTFRNSSC
ncbi:hypothetical protein BJV78DRAFT_1257717, partial [Lactifluus subvellereus]